MRTSLAYICPLIFFNFQEMMSQKDSRESYKFLTKVSFDALFIVTSGDFHAQTSEQSASRDRENAAISCSFFNMKSYIITCHNVKVDMDSEINMHSSNNY